MSIERHTSITMEGDSEYFYVQPLSKDGFIAACTVYKFGVRKESKSRKGEIIIPVANPHEFFEAARKMLKEKFEEVDENIIIGDVYTILMAVGDLQEEFEAK